MNFPRYSLGSDFLVVQENREYVLRIFRLKTTKVVHFVTPSKI
jgi:hypothetical protein